MELPRRDKDGKEKIKRTEVVEADQVHVEGDRGRDVGPVLQVAKEAHANVQAAERDQVKK